MGAAGRGRPTCSSPVARSGSGTPTTARTNRSPTFRVQFDSDLSPGKIFYIPYELKKNAAPAHEWENARRYTFRYDGSTKFIDLHGQ
jgi:hypothetical protein